MLASAVKMRKLGPNPDPVYEPRSDEERRVISELRLICTEEIKAVYRRGEYPVEEQDGLRVDPGYDFVVVTGKRHRGRFVNGREYGISVTPDGFLVEELSSWTT